MPLAPFHPAVAAWFERRFGAATEVQARAWPAIRSGAHTLIAAPTGSGKTLAAFLAALDELARDALAGPLEDATRVVYVSPLRALSNDIKNNLEEPLAGIRAELAARGLGPIEIRTALRTGDTPAAERTAMAKRPPHVLVTTPESLFLLLTSESGRNMLRTARTAIVDEIHALAPNRRGAHLALSLARLEALAAPAGGLTRIGLSATQRPIEEVARWLVGVDAAGNVPPCTIVDVGHARRLDLGLEFPSSPLAAVMANEVWEEVYDRTAELIREHKTTLVFVNTRRRAERTVRHLADRLGEGAVAAHHGSLSREKRLEAERRLKAGDLRAVVATSSLELGIDVGAVELVVQVGSTRSIAGLLQRVGRSGHHLAGLPKGRVFPTSRDELVECAALLDAVRRGELDRLHIPEKPLDVLAQQMVAAVAAEEWSEDDLYALVRRAWPYRDLARAELDELVAMLAQGFHTRRGRRSAYLHHDAVNGRLRARRGARMTALTSGGAIPDTADYDVLLEPAATFIGTVNEDFAVESLAGDIFQLGNLSWRILKVEPGRIRVEDARGQPPSIPFWLGEAPARTEELSGAVSRLRETVAALLAAAPSIEEGVETVVAWLTGEVGLSPAAARQVTDYLAAGWAALGVLPSQRTLVAERFFDEAGDMHLVLHSTFGSRVNRAFGLALRKRFCQSFNFELQAAASDDAVVLSLGPTHSFPLPEVFRFLRSDTVRGVLTQAMLDSPLFPVRWRWNVSRSLALPRFRGGKRVPPRLQRQQAEDLAALLFPDQLACFENIVGEREIPDHPLVRQTVQDCLEEAMDATGLERLLARVESGEVAIEARDLTEPSPLAHEILNARVYEFLDDAPLEERRTQAVMTRRWLDVDSAAELGTLDAAAIERVREQAWPDPEDADELHDALVTLGFLREAEGQAGNWDELFAALVSAGRATVAAIPPRDAGEPAARLWIAAERLAELLAIHPEAPLAPELSLPPRLARSVAPEEALVEIVRGRLGGLGPVTAERLASETALPRSRVDAALAALEGEGFVLRGRFTPDLPAGEEEWCERRLLARIHRATVERLRREIEPVSIAELLRFLLVWQRVAPAERAEGGGSLPAVLEQLEGFGAPAAAWESEILPARIAGYEPEWLDSLCMSGRWVWGRTAPAAIGGGRGGSLRATPLAFLQRGNLPLWSELAPAPPAPPAEGEEERLSSAAAAALAVLRERGACFFDEVARASGLLQTQLETALAELVAAGRITADAPAGLRALLTPAHRRPRIPAHRGAGSPLEAAGRWSLLRSAAERGAEPSPEAVEAVARVLLRRYGVVFKKLLERETLLPPWRDLLRVYRRLEARGELRGGRFVAGPSGEQYALPEAVGKLRSLRRSAPAGEMIAVSAADPLNLLGVLTPGARLPALTRNRLLFRDGLPIAVREAGRTRFLVDLDPAARWRAETALLRRPPHAKPAEETALVQPA
ncbi:MAG TPA: DEAD/DEAH box helicase [Thermoanaerobaculia bacterium]|nr:DEAD/DEAH box helicase [Thermoanaerobaculia bacterium]